MSVYTSTTTDGSLYVGIWEQVSRNQIGYKVVLGNLNQVGQTIGLTTASFMFGSHKELPINLLGLNQLAMNNLG